MDLMDYRRKIIANSPHLASASGAIATFSDGADLPLKSLNVGIEPVQSGSGDPSPSNIRPISGWNAVNVTRAGKNLWNPNDVFTGFINATTRTIQANSACKICYIRATPNTTYTISKMAGVRFSVACSDVELALNAPLYGVITNHAGTSITITTRNSTKYLLTWCYYGGVDTATEAEMLASVQFELGSTATPYEPYNGVNVSIDLGQTVYGGTLNPMTGVLTAYPYYASYNGETLTGRWVSDRDKYVAGTTPTIGAQVVDMSGTGAEIQLTPHQVRSLYGNNSIFADTGNVALEYWAHP